MQLALQAQYDNISEKFGFTARFRWEYWPGTRSSSLGQSAQISNLGFVAQTTRRRSGVGKTFRF
jgi:hypothetical protein